MIKISVIILSCAITFAFLFPVVLNINRYIPGSQDTNETYGYLWYFWLYKQEILIGREAAVTLIAYPFGIDFSKLFHYPVYSFINKTASRFFPGILYFNINVILSFVATFIVSYMMFFWMTKNRPCAFFVATAFAFCPYHFARVWQQMGLAHLEFYVLGVFSLLLLIQRLDIKRWLFFILASFLVFSFDLYYGYFFVVTGAIFVVYYLFTTKDSKARLRFIAGIAVSGAIVLLLLIPEIAILRRGLGVIDKSSEWQTIYIRPFQDLFTQSAKPLSFLLPATTHPIFGKFTEQFIGSPLYGVSYTEHALYLGWVPLILAFVAFRGWQKRKKQVSSIQHPVSCSSESFYVGFFIWLAIVAWLFSQPPYFSFPYFKIYMPSFFMYKLLPMFRAYCRFGIVVMFAISVLAGFGLKFIISNIRYQKSKILVTSLLCGLVLFEFWNWPPYKVIDLTKHPKVYDWLKIQKGDFVIAEYPLDTESPNEYYKFCQTIHGKKIINGTFPGTYANKVAKAIWKLSEPKTPQALSWMKVKYVLVHLNDYERSNDVEVSGELEKIRSGQIQGLKFMQTFDGIDVYEPTAQSIEPDVK